MKKRLDIPKPPYSDEVATKIKKWRADSTIATPEIFEAFHIHPDLASRAGVLGAGFLAHGRLSVRDREIVIDRVTARHGAEHEWGLHVTKYGPLAGLNEKQIDSTGRDLTEIDHLWLEDELRLMEVVDELAATAELSDDSFGFLRERYDDDQIVEFILLTGWYRTVSSMCNVLQVAPHPECRPFPSTSE